jgi:tetratricopeptide (TPR) repeat protein
MAHMTKHLWFLAFMEHPTPDNKRDAIRQTIKEFDSMNTSNKNYQMTRREALCSLATLPLMTFGLTTPGKAVQPAQYGSALAQCTASLEACWELYRSSDASDTSLAFQSVSKYLPILETIARNTSQYRKEALDLAVHYALLKTALSWHCAGLTETLQYAKDAVALSKETGDILLQLSSYSKLAWTYLYVKKYGAALATAQEAQVLLEQSATPLPPGIRGGIYSTLALMQANNGKQPDAAVRKATEVDPGNECYAFMEFTRSNLPMEVGLIYCHQGNQTKAMEALETIIDPTTYCKNTAELGRAPERHQHHDAFIPQGERSGYGKDGAFLDGYGRRS